MTPTTSGLDISVLLPVFIRQPSCKILHQLSRAIASVMGQSYPARMEVVVIDDGSPQPVEDLIRQAKICRPDNLRIVRSARNNGLVHALNLGLGATKYDLIARLDADDVWLPGKVEQQAARFAADPDLSIVATGMTLIFEDGRSSEVHIRPDGWSAVLRFFVDVGCPFPHGSVLARKDIYKLLGGYSHSADVSHCEDYALWSIWLRFFKPAMIEQTLYEYTVSASSVSIIHSKQQMRASGQINRAFQQLGIVDAVPSAIADLARILNISILQAGVLCYRLWHYRPAINLPAEAFGPLRKVLIDRSVRLGLSRGRPAVMEVADLLDGFGPVAASTTAASSVTATVH